MDVLSSTLRGGTFFQVSISVATSSTQCEIRGTFNVNLCFTQQISSTATNPRHKLWSTTAQHSWISLFSTFVLAFCDLVLLDVNSLLLCEVKIRPNVTLVRITQRTVRCYFNDEIYFRLHTIQSTVTKKLSLCKMLQ